MKVPPKSLVMGRPGKVRRLLTHAEIAEDLRSCDRYVGYRLEYRSAGSLALHQSGGEVGGARCFSRAA